MNKSMEWVVDSMTRYLCDKNQSMPHISEDKKEDEIVLEINDLCQLWYVIQYLLFIDIKHIWIWNVLYKQHTTATTYIRFDLKNDTEHSLRFI